MVNVKPPTFLSQVAYTDTPDQMAAVRAHAELSGATVAEMLRTLVADALSTRPLPRRWKSVFGAHLDRERDRAQGYLNRKRGRDDERARLVRQGRQGAE